MPRDATRRGDECVVVVAVASARSSTVSEVTGTLRLALVLDVAGSPALTPRLALVLGTAVLLTGSTTAALCSRSSRSRASSTSQPRDDCTTASERICTDTRCSTLTAPCHVRCLRRLETVSAAAPWTTSTLSMQQNVTVTRGTCNRANRSTTFPMFSNRNVTHRTRTSGPLGGSSQTNGPGHRECTVANHGQQRPPFEHTRRVSSPGHSMTALTRGPATSGAQFKLPSHPSSCSPHAVQGGNLAATPALCQR